MRNYIKLRAVRIYPLPFDEHQFYVVFGTHEDENLRFYVDRTVALARQGDPSLQFRIPMPSIIWFELNADNLSTLVNQASGAIWNQTRLNDVFPPLSDEETLYEMTRVESEGSPRGTWSNGH